MFSIPRLSATESASHLRPLVFAIVWASVMTAAVAVLTLGLRAEAVSGRTLAVLLVFATGSLIGALLAWLAARVLSWPRRHRIAARFAAMVITLSLGTAGITAFLFFLQLRIYYLPWHANEISAQMFWETIFTAAGTAYIFGVMSARLLLPVMLLPLFAAAWFFARIEPDVHV